MHRLWHFHAFIHLHCASHLGTLDAPREGHDDGVEPEDSVGGPILKMEGPWSTCLNRRCSPSECRLTKTNQVLDPR